MYRGNRSRIVPIIVIILVVALLVGGLVSVGRIILGGQTGPTASQTSGNNFHSELLDTSAIRSVRLTVRGPIVADENYQTYQITVSSTTRNYTLNDGYNGSVATTKTYSNSQVAYEQFVYALDKSNASTVNSSGSSQDLRGACATGNTFRFEVLDGDKVDQTVWTSTCTGSRGTMTASPALMQRLFDAQVPNFTAPFTTALQ